MDHNILRPFDDTSRPSSDGVELPSKTMRWYERRKKTLLWILAITIVVALSREFGFITLEFFSINSSGLTETWSSPTHLEDQIQRYNSKGTNRETKATMKNFNIRFDIRPDPYPEIDTLIIKAWPRRNTSMFFR